MKATSNGDALFRDPREDVPRYQTFREINLLKMRAAGETSYILNDVMQYNIAHTAVMPFAAKAGSKAI